LRLRQYIQQQREKLREFSQRAEVDKNRLYNAVCESLNRQNIEPASLLEAPGSSMSDDPGEYDYAPIIPGSLSTSVMRGERDGRSGWVQSTFYWGYDVESNLF
jgi:hypothetical protein